MWFPPVSSTVAVAFASSPSSTCSPPNPSQQWSSSLRPGLWITASATMGHHILYYLASHRDAGVLSALTTVGLGKHVFGRWPSSDWSLPAHPATDPSTVISVVFVTVCCSYIVFPNSDQACHYITTCSIFSIISRKAPRATHTTTRHVVGERHHLARAEARSPTHGDRSHASVALVRARHRPARPDARPQQSVGGPSQL